MKDWFAGLDTREQTFVALGGAVAIFVLLYGLLWVPFDKRHEQLARDVDTWQSSLAQLRPLKDAAGRQQSGVTARNRSNQTPIVVVDQTTRARGIHSALKRSQPTTSSGIRVEFENVAFDDLILWLGDINSQQGMTVQQGSFSSAQNAAGRVNATLTIERAP